MKQFLRTLALVAVCSTPAAADNGLSIEIAPSKNVPGGAVIDRQAGFRVVIKNQSVKPIRIWNEECHPGFGTVSFEYDDGSGKPAVMIKRATQPSNWKNHPPRTITISPNGTFDWVVEPSRIWGEYVWLHVPEPNTGKPIRLTGMFEIKPSDAAKKQEVWTGRITSPPVSTLVVDEKLKTPLEYLDRDCPNQAIRLMQADRSWISKTDDLRQTPLHIAVHRGLKDAVEWLLSNGANVNAKAYNSFRPIHFAKDPEIVRLLIRHKADVNVRDVTGTVLQNAAGEIAYREHDKEYAEDCARWRAIVKILVDAGATYDIKSACSLGDIDRVRVLIADKERARDKDAMRAAASSGRAAIVKLLLEHGADPEDADFGGLPLSDFAIQHPDVLKVIFAAGAKPNVILDYRGNGQGPQGSTLMHEAAQRNAVGSAEVLLTNGADVNAVIQWNGLTPLHLACFAGHVEMVDWLLKHKADPKASGKNGGTPMSMAAAQIRPSQDDDNARFAAIIRRLERAGIEIDIFAAIACNDLQRVKDILRANPKAASGKDVNGQPALRQAVSLDRREMVTALLDAGCDPNIRSAMEGTGDKGETALMTAAWWGRPELVKLLIERKANVNARADNGITALHDAARMSHFEIVRSLLAHGADVNAKSDRGETPLDESACYGEHPEMAQLLRSHGGKGKKSK